MHKRPNSVTFVGGLFVAVGLFGLVYHATGFNQQHPLEDGLILFVRVLAIVAGVFMLRGANWARWLALAWIAYHVVLSAFHSLSETVIHIVVLVGIAYVLLGPAASAYFRAARAEPASPAV